MADSFEMKKFTTANFLNFALGFLGLQFAWQMRIILSAPVTENLGADPFIYGLIWLAGPFTGMVVQPIIGALSDKTKSRFGRRRPYLLGGAIIASIALWLFPNSGNIADCIAKFTGMNLPVWSGLLIAAIMIWIIDACINIAQGPYRALIPDVVLPEQHAMANSYISLAIGLGSVIAAATAPFLKYVLHYQMSIVAQFIMAALAFSLAMIWTCMTIREKSTLNDADVVEEKKDEVGFWQSMKEFFSLSPEVSKICIMQFFTWIGTMCLLIFFTNFAIHTVYGVPDLTKLATDVQQTYLAAQTSATNYSSICFAIFNLICFVIAVPIGFFAGKFGNKKVHIISLLSMALAYVVMGLFPTSKIVVAACMALSGIGWASVCALPFAMLSKYIKPGTEGSVMGIFNIFIAGPQVFVCTLVAWIINNSIIQNGDLLNYHYEYSFFIGAVCLIIAALLTKMVKE